MATSLQSTFVKATAGRVSRPAKVVVQASLRQEVVKVAKMAGVSVASLALALSAHAGETTIKMGADNGALVFEPPVVKVAAGDTITFINNAGFPHNVVFDDEAVPAGVNADAISHDDYFNAPGEKHVVKLTAPGDYSYFCEPHSGAGMKGKIIVS